MNTNNWKSLIGYFTILLMYPYSIIKEMGSETISTTGLFSIIVIFAIMGRSKELLEILKNLVEAYKTKWSK